MQHPYVFGASANFSTEGLELPTLEFVPANRLDGYIAAAHRLHRQRRCRILIRAKDSTILLATEVQRRISAELTGVECFLETLPAPSGQNGNHSVPAGDDAIFLFENCAADLSNALMEFVDVPVSIVAPITEHYFRRRAAFMISIPKSGTHMLFELLGAFNLVCGGQARGSLSPQHFYFACSENSHTATRTFFSSLNGEPRGGGDHPFFGVPAVFMYRNPLDIVVSEAFYVGQHKNTALAHYYSSMPMEERLLRLIGDDPLLRSLRRRMREYVAWLRLPNVIPISFEELVGPRGGGTLVEQLKTIWSLQLKMHVPGSPAYYAKAVFRKDTHTFRKGAINSHAEHLTDACYAALRDLDPDFLHEFGYRLDDRFGPGYVPRFVNEFRRRPLVLTPPVAASGEKASSSATQPFSPGSVYAYRGYLAAIVGRVHCAVPEDFPRPVDPRLEAVDDALHVAATADELLTMLDTDPLADDELPVRLIPDMSATDLFRSDPTQPVLAKADVSGFNIILFENRYFCIEIDRGPLDVQWDDMADVFVTETLEEAIAYCRSRDSVDDPAQYPSAEMQIELPSTARMSDLIHLVSFRY